MEPITDPAIPSAQNSRSYVFGVAGVVLGLGLMVMAVVDARNQPSPASPWGSNFLLFVGQVVASAGGCVAVTSRTRRREIDATEDVTPHRFH